MQVTRLPRDPGPAGWNAILPPAPAYPALESDHRTDWLIIGAGFAGLSAARRLRQLVSGDRVTVVDAVPVATGPAGRNSGFMIDLPHDLSSQTYAGDRKRDLSSTFQNRAAIEFALKAAQDYAMPSETLDLSGKINAAATAKGDTLNRSYAAHLDELGQDYRLLDARDMARTCGTDFYISGLWTPGTAIIQPALYVRCLAAGLAADRTGIFENTPVTALSRNGDWQASTPKGSITAGKVILAVNGHANSFGFYRRRLMHVFTYASMTRALTDAEITRLGGQSTWGVTPADPMGTTVRRISGQGGHRIVIRNRFTFDPTLEVPENRLHRVARDHDRAFAARFPMLAGVAMEHRWGGRLCLSRNDVPAFGELEPGLFSACCQNGLGTVKGTLAGMRVTELATGAQTPSLQAFANQPAPQKLPPWPLTELGAPAYLRWQEHRAGKEL